MNQSNSDITSTNIVEEIKTTQTNIELSNNEVDT